MSNRLQARIAALSLLLLVPGCGGGEGGNAGVNEADEAVLSGEDQLSADPALADEAAADEAADMNLYGGNAAAGETVNGAGGVAAPANPAAGNGS